MLHWLRRQPERPHLKKIYVSREAFEEGASQYAVASDVIDYTNATLHKGLFLRGEFPDEAYQLYCADYYVSQVMNGGHSQYIANDRTSGLGSTVQDALAGLTLIGSEYAKYLKAMIRWTVQNPSDAAAQNGFTVRSDVLDALDKRVYALNSTEVYYDPMRAWLSTSPLVEVLPRAVFSDEITNLKDRNAAYARRERTQIINALDAGVTRDAVAPYRAVVAGYASHGKPIEIRAITSGRHSPMIAAEDFTRPDAQLWTFNSSLNDQMYGQLFQGQYEILAKTPEDKLGVLFTAPAAEIDLYLAEAARRRPGRYALDLLALADPSEQPMFLGFENRPWEEGRQVRGMNFMVVCRSGTIYAVAFGKDFVALFHGERGEVARISGRAFKSLSAEDHTKLT